MKLLLRSGSAGRPVAGLATVALSVAIAMAQVPAPSGPVAAPGPVAVAPITGTPVSGNTAGPAVKPVETTTKPGGDLEFKPPADPEGAPPPPPPTAQSSAGKANAASAPTMPSGPKVAPAGPQVIEADAGPPGLRTTPSISPGGLKQGKPYVIGPLDVLEVRVWNDAKLSGMFDVGTDGMISMPLVGAIPANGLTAAELTVAIKQKLTEVIIEPEVMVQVLRINSKKYSIFGGCLRQGEFPLVGEVTVLDAFANCGGFKDFANLKKIYILRGNKQLKFNYKDVIRGKNMEQNIPLENGDRIFIPE